MYQVVKAIITLYILNKQFNKFLGKGYHTFQDIKTDLESNSGVSLVLHKPETTCTMTLDSSTTIVLHQNLTTLLGFNTRILLPGSTTKSAIINVNLGLKYLRVSCKIINQSLNTENGKKNNVLINLPVTSTLPLFGSTQTFRDIESRVAINKGAINQLEFHVTDQDGATVTEFWSILLEIYIV